MRMFEKTFWSKCTFFLIFEVKLCKIYTWDMWEENLVLSTFYPK